MVQSDEMLNISAIDSIQKIIERQVKIIGRQGKIIEEQEKIIENQEKTIERQENTIEKLVKKNGIVQGKFRTLYKRNFYRKFQIDFNIWAKSKNLKLTNKNRKLYTAYKASLSRKKKNEK